MRVPGGKPFEFVRGAGEFLGWGGVHSERGFTAPPANRPQLAINLICAGGRLRMRPHEVKYLENLPWTNIHGIFDLDCPPLRMWSVIEGCPGADGGTLMTYSFDDRPEFQPVAKFWGSPTGSLGIASFGSDVYLGENNNFRKMLLRTQPYGEAAQNTGEMGSRVLHQFTGTGAVISAMREHDGILWVGVNTSGPNYTIYSWNGVSMVSSVTAAGTIASMGSWEDNLVVTFNDAGANYIKLRGSGAGASWTNVVPGAGSILAARRPQSIKSYRGVLYIIDATTGVWSYNGAALSSAHTVAGATMRALEVFNDKLCYGYNLAASCCIGTYDWATTTWTDIAKNLTTQYANNRSLHGLCSMRGSLWAGLGSSLFYVDEAGGSDLSYYTARLAVSPGKAIGGTWIGTGSPTYNAGNDATGPMIFMVT